jgi:hypothetical protein
VAVNRIVSTARSKPAGLTKAAPIEGSIERIPNGSMEKASCRHCDGRITRAIAGRNMPWWHVETLGIRCVEKGKR